MLLSLVSNGLDASWTALSIVFKVNWHQQLFCTIQKLRIRGMSLNGLQVPDLSKSIQTLKLIQIRFPNFGLSWIESLHKNWIRELSWVTYLLELNWVWIESFLSTKSKNWIWFESSLTQKNLKKLRVCNTWIRIHESTHCWLEIFSIHHEISIGSN